jgi:hypothetical protein
LTISAVRVELTVTTLSIAALYSATPASTQSGVVPPRILGMAWVGKRALPGSSRSGEKQTKMSFPARKPRAAARGTISSSVVPG